MNFRHVWLLAAIVSLFSMAPCAGGDVVPKTTAGNAALDTSGDSIASVGIGFAGRYKVGVWTPVEVVFSEAQQAPGKVSLTLLDGDGVPSRVWASFAKGATSARLYARFGRVNGQLTVELETEDGSSSARRVFTTSAEPGKDHILPAVPAERTIVIAVGIDREVVMAAVRRRGLPKEKQSLVVGLESFKRLPHRWFGYEAIEAVVIGTVEADSLAGLRPNDPRVEALDRWVRLGGHLLFSVGSRAEEVLAEDAPLARFSPGEFQQMADLRQTGAFEAYCDSVTAVPSPPGGRVSIPVPKLANLRGVVEARESDLPLIIRSARGLGQIAFVATDLDTRPLSTWTERPMFIARLLNIQDQIGEETVEAFRGVDIGYTNMAGQLRSSLDRFEGVRLVPFWTVGMLIVVYILLIGAGDYFFLRKVARSMQLTWITFPIVVLAVCVGVYFLAYYLKGDRAHVNQVDLVDVDSVSGDVRGTSWIGLFSPRSQSFDLSFKPTGRTAVPADQENSRAGIPAGLAVTGKNACPTGGDDRVLLSWLGLPGSALGGMNPRTADPMLWQRPYTFSADLSEMSAMPLGVWSSKSLTARWTSSGHACPDVRLFDDGQVLTGTVVNTLDFPLSECLLFYDRWVYDLGKLEPGDSETLGATSRRNELKTLLTGRKRIAEGSLGDFRQVSTPYDKSSVDVAYILRLMMFYDAAGGQPYTGLSNGYQQFVDLSGLLNTDRAILVGEAGRKQPAAELLRDGQPLAAENDRHETFYRFVFPVKTNQ